MTTLEQQSSVSVVIPAHNARRTIGATLASVFLQTQKPLELIVVDDASEDGTASLVESISSSAPIPVRLLRSRERGAAAARNAGVQAAEAELIAFLDSDDLWYPDKIEKQRPLLSAEVGYVGALMHYLTPRGKVLGTNARYRDAHEATTILRAGKAMPLALSTWLMRRDLFQDLGGFNPEFRRAQDFEFAVRVARRGYQVTWPIGRVLAGYTMHETAATANAYTEQYLAAELVRHRITHPASDITYQSWMSDIDRHRHAVRAASSGQHFRTGGIALGERRPGKAALHFAAAACLKPSAVIEKLRWRTRGQEELAPKMPPSALRGLLEEPR